MTIAPLSALIHSGRVHALASDPATWPGDVFDVRDVSGVPGIAIGWIANEDDTYAAPVVAGPSAAALNAYADQVQTRILAAGIEVNVAAPGAPARSVLCDGTNATRADLALLALYGQQYPAGTKAWLDNEGGVTALTGAELVTLATLVGTWIAGTYDILVRVRAGIGATTPSITATAQIDAAFAPSA